MKKRDDEPEWKDTRGRGPPGNVSHMESDGSAQGSGAFFSEFAANFHRFRTLRRGKLREGRGPTLTHTFPPDQNSIPIRGIPPYGVQTEKFSLHPPFFVSFQLNFLHSCSLSYFSHRITCEPKSMIIEGRKSALAQVAIGVLAG